MRIKTDDIKAYIKEYNNLHKGRQMKIIFKNKDNSIGIITPTQESPTKDNK